MVVVGLHERPAGGSLLAAALLVARAAVIKERAHVRGGAAGAGDDGALSPARASDRDVGEASLRLGGKEAQRGAKGKPVLEGGAHQQRQRQRAARGGEEGRAAPLAGEEAAPVPPQRPERPSVERAVGARLLPHRLLVDALVPRVQREREGARPHPVPHANARQQHRRIVRRRLAPLLAAPHETDGADRRAHIHLGVVEVAAVHDRAVGQRRDCAGACRRRLEDGVANDDVAEV
mmetsp:Transcript_40289/g.134347  ORF Transcript_40289/g.134347 Transcript_40289/m.134347 type:complete len:234 (+) Transcript_40289:456-1157(+)